MSAQLPVHLPIRPAVQLTRRGRLYLIGLPALLLAATLLTAIGFFTAPAVAATAGSLDAARSPVQVTVESGETLWGLAARLAPERDPRDVVADIVALNNMGSSLLTAGQQLFIPATR